MALPTLAAFVGGPAERLDCFSIDTMAQVTTPTAF